MLLESLSELSSSELWMSSAGTFRRPLLCRSLSCSVKADRKSSRLLRFDRVNVVCLSTWTKGGFKQSKRKKQPARNWPRSNLPQSVQAPIWSSASVWQLQECPLCLADLGLMIAAEARFRWLALSERSSVHFELGLQKEARVETRLV